MKILETNHLILRTFDTTDLDAMAAINSDLKVCEFLPTIGTHASTEAGIKRMIQHQLERGFSLYAVELKTTHEMIGWIGLMTPSFEAHFTPAIEIGWRCLHTGIRVMPRKGQKRSYTLLSISWD